jgi:superfamily I DNA and/or RNA helicase
VQAYTLDALVEGHDDYRQAKKIRKEAFALQNQASKFRRARPERGAKQALRQESRAMFDEARQLEARAVERILDNASVVLSTLTALDSTILGQRHFDLCVIDEAGQSTEPAAWIPVPRSQRLVLAGDHQQLPPHYYFAAGGASGVWLEFAGTVDAAKWSASSPTFGCAISDASADYGF